MVSFESLLKGFKDNFTASIAAVMVLGIFGLCGFIVQLYEDRIGAEKEVLKCQQYWQSQIDSIRRQELEKTEKQVQELNELLKQVKKR